MTDLTNRQIAYETAAVNAVSVLQSIDIEKRCSILDIPLSEDGKIKISVLGNDLLISMDDYSAVIAETGTPAHPIERILALHYLMCNFPIVETGELISFSELSGGQFYLEPFRSRTVVLLEKNISNNIELLYERLARFKWEPVKLGDFGACIHAIGKIFITLVYRTGDEEFPPAAEILFDSSIKRVYNTDDVSALTGRMCVGLL
jgi:hypothetical protein